LARETGFSAENAENNMTAENPPSLFNDLAEQAAPSRDPGRPRYVEVERHNIVFEQFELDRLIGEEHPARAIWEYVESLDLRELYERIGARAHTPGRPPPDPRVVLALWLYACVEGVGSARELDRLTQEHHGFRWLRGGVPLNYHLLSDFRWQASEVADRLLTHSVASLWSEGLVDLASLTHDGVRIRGAAGAASFRRLETLERLLAQVEERIARLKQEINEAPDASQQRLRAARERAVRERRHRVVTALETARAVAARQAAKEAAKKAKAPPSDDGAAGPVDKPKPDTPQTPKTSAMDQQEPAAAKPDATGTPGSDTTTSAQTQARKKEPRFSTTDVEAHVMRMADGGYRPAYNVQLTGDLESGLVVGLSVDMTGSDGGLLAPAVADVERRFGFLPQRLLADGGYTALDDIAAVAGKGITVFCPLKPRRNPSNDPAAPRPGDPPAVADWRRRMVDDAAAGKAGWMRRRGEHERINANLRNHGLLRFNVRGSLKVKAVCLLHALAHNILTGCRLRAAAA
jgi:transposase